MDNDNYLELGQKLSQLIKEAENLGATSAAIIPSKEIQVKDHLAALCNGEHICPNYGLAASCPPHIEGPVTFRKWQAKSQYSITVKIELPASVMFSSERNDIMKLLHQIVAAVERKGINLGFMHAKGFAGGSCKDLFCDNQDNCCVLAEEKTCPHPESARPSISGFGVDAVQLMKSSGWPAPIAEESDVSYTDAMSWVAGLILLA